MQRISIEQLNQAVTALKAGEVIVFPTETSYGLGCDATSEVAVERVIEIKGRDRVKGLPLIVASLEAAEDCVALSEQARELARRHWPGALNIIAPVKPSSPVAPSCAVHATQSVRVSAHPIAAKLAAELGRPVVATSANISGAAPIYDPSEFETMFDAARGLPDLVLDAGALTSAPPSTTVKIVGDEVEIIRQGEIEI